MAYALLGLALFCFGLVASVKMIGLGCHFIRTISKRLKQKGDQIIEDTIK